jgi:hypothetical protein
MSSSRPPSRCDLICTCSFEPPGPRTNSCGTGCGIGWCMSVCACVRACAAPRRLTFFLSPPEQDLGAYEVKLRLPSGDELPVKVNVVKR